MRLILCSFLVVFYCSCNQSAELSDQPIVIEEDKNTTLVDQAVDLSIVMGKFDPSAHDDFVLIEKKYADREGLYLQEEAYSAFKRMYKAAKELGIDLIIRSATRNFDYQRGIWERKWKANQNADKNIIPKANALKILKYSSMPSTSRHHWGTDIDLNSFENSWFGSGEGLKLYEWMVSNAADYGYCQVYTAKDEDRPDGYNEEKWHWSYLPIANKYYKIADANMKDEMIKGFDGSEVAEEIGVVEKYILGIDKSCK